MTELSNTEQELVEEVKGILEAFGTKTKETCDEQPYLMMMIAKLCEARNKALAQILALIKEALPELAKEAGYGMPIDDDGKALIEYHHAWAKANGYTLLSDDQSLPDIPEFAYDKSEDRKLLKRGAINYSKLLADWRRVILPEIKGR